MRAASGLQRGAVEVLARRRLSAAAKGADPFKHCTELLKRGDYDGYLYSLLQRKQRRQASMVIRAFNVETAGIKDAVRGNVVTGRMRMQWWKDCLADIFEGYPPPQPIATALSEVLQKQERMKNGALTKRWFDRILDARMDDLEVSQPRTMKEMEEGLSIYSEDVSAGVVRLAQFFTAQNRFITDACPSYAENTASSLLYISLELNGVRAGLEEEVLGVNEIGHAASHVGKAVGICTLLRSIPQPKPAPSLQMGGIAGEACVLPAEVMRKNGLSYSVLQRGPKNDEEAHALAGSVFEVATVAKLHMDSAIDLLATAREKGKHYLAVGAFGALLPGVRAMWFLEMLEECQFNPYDPRLTPQSPLRFQMRLARSLFKEKFRW